MNFINTITCILVILFTSNAGYLSNVWGQPLFQQAIRTILAFTIIFTIAFLIALPPFHERGHKIGIKLTSRNIKDFSDTLYIKCSFSFTDSNFYSYLMNNRNNKNIQSIIKLNAASGKIIEIFTIVFASIYCRIDTSHELFNYIILAFTLILNILSIFEWVIGSDIKYYSDPSSYEYKNKKQKHTLFKSTK